ncbi:SPFH domain-containing protein, partial [Paraburkholderia sp. SIMBA_009]
AGFSFQGTELIGVVAGESENPRTTIPRAVSQIFWRILQFYVLAIIVIGVLIAVYAGSGLFVVQDGQTGVVLQLGKLAGTVGEGVHWRAPYPFSSHEIVDTTQVRSIEIGRN